MNVAIFVLDKFILNDLLSNYLAQRFVLADDFNVAQFIGYMWLHGDFGHLFFNMLMLFFMGPILEQLWGGKKFLQYYLITGIGAGILYAGANFIDFYPGIQAADTYISNPTPEAFEIYAKEGIPKRLRVLNSGTLADLMNRYFDNPESSQIKGETISFASQAHDYALQGYGSTMVGASGALYGVLLAVAMLFPNMTVMLLFPPIPMKLKYMALGLTVFSIFSEFNRSPGDNVAHLAHLGGMLIGFILLKIWKGKNNSYY